MQCYSFFVFLVICYMLLAIWYCTLFSYFWEKLGPKRRKRLERVLSKRFNMLGWNNVCLGFMGFC